MTKDKVYVNLNLGPLTSLLRLKIIIILINWIFQGLLYMDNTERLFKISLDAIMMIILFLAMPLQSIILRIIATFLIAHTLNWIFNGQLFVLAKNICIIYNNPERIIAYATNIGKRASRENCIDFVLLYGSLVRGEIKSTSDLDIRVIRKPGIVNGFMACFFGFRERLRALINAFPLDIYIIDSREHLLKMRIDEKPEILYESHMKLSK